MQIRKRKDTGKWGYQICFHGKRFRLSGWNTKDEAQKEAEDLQAKLRREASMAASGSGMPCVDAVNGFLAYSARIGKSENRLRGLYSNFHSFILPFFTAQKRLKDITHNDIESFIDEQCKRDISKNTITHYVTDLNAMLNWAVKEEIIDINPMRKVSRKRIRPERIMKQGFTPEEIKKAESSLEKEELLFFRFLLFTGERLTEALSSKWTDVNYENREIIIRGTKTEGSLRRLDMCDGLYMTLKELEAYKTDSPYIFHHSNGKRILRRDKLFVKIKESTGIKITAKDLRDVFASTITIGTENNRPDIKTVSELLGHTNITTTQKYLFSFKEKRMKAVRVMDDIYGTESGKDTKKNDDEKRLSACNYSGGGAWNRTRDTTDMSSPQINPVF
jgi:integrase